ncbi:hypothetical protein AVO44_14955 [Ruegeria profundi]|uniref:Uncharacterized protein n=1 Tax=Ruegeria profundi TaxID=1685378 RepID=A0A0X3TPJ4_9RHOB|nr:hypothetical protein AVO44_14955 [Ruegeria profundi]
MQVLILTSHRASNLTLSLSGDIHPFSLQIAEMMFGLSMGIRSSPVAEARRGRIAIDTGAFATGVLSAVCLDGGDSRFLMAQV